MRLKTSNSPIEYTLKRAGRKTIGISVERDGSVVVTAPQTVDDTFIQQHVHSKRLWIWEKQAIKKHQNSDVITKQFIAGESFEYLGRRYRLKFIETQDRPLKMHEGWFCMRKDVQESAKECFIGWYSERLEDKIKERLKHVFGYSKQTMPNIRVIDLGFRWGSCSKDGTLNFNWKIVMAPISIIDYVIAHELTHLYEHSHSDRFWKELGKIMPGYQKKKDWLKNNGMLLII